MKIIMEKTAAIKKGYVQDNNGRLRRKNALDSYFEQGYLELPHSPFSAEKRKKAGEILARDFYLGNRHNLQSIKFLESNIPTTGEVGIEISLYYKNRYLEAIKNIPYEFREVVFRVCIEDKKIVSGTNSNKNLRDKNFIYYQKMLLVLGLERLLKYYLTKNKKSS